MRSRLPELFLTLYVVAATASLVWPVAAWAGDGPEPWVLGLPYGLFWSVLWVLATAAALTLYHAATHGRRHG